MLHYPDCIPHCGQTTGPVPALSESVYEDSPGNVSGLLILRVTADPVPDAASASALVLKSNN